MAQRVGEFEPRLLRLRLCRRRVGWVVTFSLRLLLLLLLPVMFRFGC